MFNCKTEHATVACWPVGLVNTLLVFARLCWIVRLQPFITLLSTASVTSKTFVVHKVIIFRKSSWFCLKAHNLPLFHAKFHHAVSIGLSSTCFWSLMKFEQNLPKKSYFWFFFANMNPYKLCTLWAKMIILVYDWHLLCIILVFYHFITNVGAEIQLMFFETCSNSKKKKSNENPDVYHGFLWFGYFLVK